MKKMMIAAAVAALTVGAFAAPCGETTTGCKTVFTVKFSGKTAIENSKETYATVQKISGKGTLTFAEDYTEELTIKVGKAKHDLSIGGGDITKWSFFGKNLEKLESGEYKPGKTYKMESDLGITFNTAFLDGDEDEGDIANFNVYQVAFGKVKVYITKDHASSGCADAPVKGCLPELTPISYSGWFTGDFEPTCADWADYDDGCIVFEDNDIALIGGTWSAKYSKKLSR